jgi:hypothetical protein
MVLAIEKKVRSQHGRTGSGIRRISEAHGRIWRINMSKTDEKTEDAISAAVLSALENPKFRWRTIGGIAKETGIDAADVGATIAKEVGNNVVLAPAPSQEGEKLFSTRNRFLETASLGEKLIGAFKNRVL